MLTSLQQQIKLDMVKAMKEKDELTKGVLRMVSAEIRNAEIDKPDHQLTEEDVLKVLMKIEKQRKDSIRQYQSAGREDLAAVEQEELTVIERYLPEKISEDEITKVVDEVLGEVTSRDFGLVMRSVMAKLQGKADGNQVRIIVQQKLS